MVVAGLWEPLVVGVPEAGYLSQGAPPVSQKLDELPVPMCSGVVVELYGEVPRTEEKLKLCV